MKTPLLGICWPTPSPDDYIVIDRAKAIRDLTGATHLRVDVVPGQMEMDVARRVDDVWKAEFEPNVMGCWSPAQYARVTLPIFCIAKAVDLRVIAPGDFLIPSAKGPKFSSW